MRSVATAHLPKLGEVVASDVPIDEATEHSSTAWAATNSSKTHLAKLGEVVASVVPQRKSTEHTAIN